MSDHMGRTEPLPTGSTRVGEDLHVDHGDAHLGGTARPRRDPRSDVDTDLRSAARGTGRDGETNRPDPIELAKRPDNRAKLLLGTALLTLLNTLLLLGILASVLGGGYEPVTVEGQACVIETGGDENVLYCQR
jgi:hypothetical protein